MLKQKYLHRKSRKTRYDHTWDTKSYKRSNTLDLFSDLPNHQKIRRQYGWCNYDSTPLKEFIKSKIGHDWNDVYSEILTKIKKDYRFHIDSDIFSWLLSKPIYDEDYIPRDNYGRVLGDRLFIDMDNIVTKKPKDELIIDAKRYVRRKKLREIIENQNKEDEPENFDFL